MLVGGCDAIIELHKTGRLLPLLNEAVADAANKGKAAIQLRQVAPTDLVPSVAAGQGCFMRSFFWFPDVVDNRTG